MSDVIPGERYGHPATFHEGDRVRLVPDKWERRFRNKTGRVRELQYQMASYAAPDGYFYLVDLDGEAITVTASSDGIAALEARQTARSDADV